MPRKSTSALKTTGPMIKVEIPEGTRKLIANPKESTVSTLEAYRDFLSSHVGKEITLEAVLDGLVGTLKADPLFSQWKSIQHAPKPLT